MTVTTGKTPYIRFDLNDYFIPHTHVRRNSRGRPMGWLHGLIEWEEQEQARRRLERRLKELHIGRFQPAVRLRLGLAKEMTSPPSKP